MTEQKKIRLEETMVYTTQPVEEREPEITEGSEGEGSLDVELDMDIFEPKISKEMIRLEKHLESIDQKLSQIVVLMKEMISRRP